MTQVCAVRTLKSYFVYCLMKFSEELYYDIIYKKYIMNAGRQNHGPHVQNYILKSIISETLKE